MDYKEQKDRGAEFCLHFLYFVPLIQYVPALLSNIICILGIFKFMKKKTFLNCDNRNDLFVLPMVERITEITAVPTFLHLFPHNPTKQTNTTTTTHTIPITIPPPPPPAPHQDWNAVLAPQSHNKV